MKKITILLISLLLTACFGPNIKPFNEKKLTLLWEKTLPNREKDCMAAFHDNEFLFFFTRYYGKTFKVTVYHVSTGNFAELPIYVEKNVSCKDAPFDYKRPIKKQFVRIAYFDNVEFKKYFDNYKKEPNELKKVINGLPNTFRENTKWNGQLTAVLQRKTFQANTIQEVMNKID